jgi:hypothetical protein
MQFPIPKAIPVIISNSETPNSSVKAPNIYCDNAYFRHKNAAAIATKPKDHKHGSGTVVTLMVYHFWLA